MEGIPLLNTAKRGAKKSFLATLPHHVHKLIDFPRVLHVVCRNGWLDVAKILIEDHNMDPKIAQDIPQGPIHGATCLHFACMSGNIELVEYLISVCGCDIRGLTSGGQSVVHFSIKGGLRVVKYLVNNHPILIPAMLSYNSPVIMWYAYYYWDNDLIKYLVVDHKCSIIIDGHTGDTILHWACRDGYIERLKYLVNECKCDVHVTNSKNGHTLLHTLCHAFYDDKQTTSVFGGILTFLIQNCSHDCCLKLNHNGASSLEYAIKSGWAKGVELICNKVYRGSNNSKSNFIEHILLLAYYHWNKSIMKFLIVDMEFIAIATVCKTVCVNGELTKLEFLINECQVHIHDTIEGTTICYSHPKKSDNYRQCSSSQEVGVAECNFIRLVFSAIRHKRSKILAFVLKKSQLHQEQEDIKLEFSAKVFHLAYFFWEENIIKCLVLEINLTAPIIDKSSGDTILHKACQVSNINQVKFLVEVCNCNPHIANTKGESLIHIACQSFYILQYLCIDCNCCPDLSGDQEVGTKAMISAIAQKEKGLVVIRHLVKKCEVEGNCEIMSFVYECWCPDIVKYLIVEAKFDIYTDATTTGDTMLHQSVMDRNQAKLEYLIDTCGCSPHIEGVGKSLIHAACHSLIISFNILQYLCIDCNICPDLKGDQEVGTKAMKLAIAQKERGLAVVKHLVEKCEVLSVKRDTYGKLISKAICENWCPYIVEYFINDANFNIYSIGRAILQLCAKDKEYRRLKILFKNFYPQIDHETATFIIQHVPLSSTHDDDNDDISYILRYLCIESRCIIKADYQTIVNIAQYCFSHSQVDILIPVVHDLIKTSIVAKCINNFEMNAILQMIIVAYYSHASKCLIEFLSLINYLIVDCHCNVASQDEDGNTVLHLACSNFTGDHSLIELIMSTGKADPLCYNKLNETPLMVLNRQCHETSISDKTRMQIEQLISRFGEVQIAHPIHLYVNIVLLGNPGVGKSTLAKVIKDRIKYSPITAPFKNVKGVELRTAGIIPHVLNDKVLGRIILHDLAGQNEYYSSHTAVLENLLQGSAAVFVLVVSLIDKNIIKSFHQWLNIIENVSHSALQQCHLIVVFSHADQSVQMKAHDFDYLKQSITTDFGLYNASNVFLHALFDLDCRKLGGASLAKFISTLSAACKSITDNDTREMSLYCHMLYDFLQRDGKSVYTLQELLQISNNQDNGLYLPKEISQIDAIICQLSSTGLIVFLRNSLQLTESWIVADKAVLLSELNGVLFAPEDFKQHVDIASNIGVVKLSDLQSIFTNYAPDLLLQFLQYMELCSVISDKFIAELTDSNLSQYVTGSTNLDQHTCIFIPALIKHIEHPLRVNKIQFKFGWCLRCSGTNFFISRFLHLMQLRLACEFSNLKSYSTFECYCNLWTKGIYWKDTKGVEALVEVVDNNQSLIVLMSCEDGAKLAMLNLIHDVLGEILTCKYQVIPQVITDEYIIDSSALHCSLTSLDNIPLYKVQLLAQCYINNYQYILDDKLNRVEISKMIAEETCNQKEICTAVFAGRDPQKIIWMKDTSVKFKRKNATKSSEGDFFSKDKPEPEKQFEPEQLLPQQEPAKLPTSMLSRLMDESAAIKKWKDKIGKLLQNMSPSDAEAARGVKIQGMAFIVGMYDATGANKDVQAMERLFENDLGFAVVRETNLTACELKTLVEAASLVEYGVGCKYIVFYYAGHGGTDDYGNSFICPISDDKEFVYMEADIFRKLVHLKKKCLLFMFDCCLNISGGAGQLKSAEDSFDKLSHSNYYVAFATTFGDKSQGSKTYGGNWTKILCKNLKQNKDFVTIMEETAYELGKEDKSCQRYSRLSNPVNLKATAKTDSIDPLEEKVEIDN